MNKKFIAVLSLILCTLTVFSACTENPDAETSSFEIITEGSFEEQTENNVTPSEKEEETTQEAQTEEETTEKEIIGKVVGYTSKGFTISEKDGITYVDGVLVANKTYSLPADYNPGALLPECETAFKKMQSAASALGYSIWNASGFRSYELQESLYTRYCNRDGKEAADRYSARPGHSEHQTGLAIDLNEISSSFANTKEGKWIAENCWQYGFILRYPKEKEAQTGYMYEAWHIRYVGVETAEKIFKSGLCLEEYYGITSVYPPEPPASEITEAPEEIISSEITEVAQETLNTEITTAAAEAQQTTEASQPVQ